MDGEVIGMEMQDIEIMNRWTGEIIISGEYNSVKD